MYVFCLCCRVVGDDNVFCACKHGWCYAGWWWINDIVEVAHVWCYGTGGVEIRVSNESLHRWSCTHLWCYETGGVGVFVECNEIFPIFWLETIFWCRIKKVDYNKHLYLQDTWRAKKGVWHGPTSPTGTVPSLLLFFFELMPCALQGSDGHLNVCGLEKKKPYGPRQMPCKKPRCNPNQKNQQNQTQPPKQTKPAPRMPTFFVVGGGWSFGCFPGFSILCLNALFLS